jgi:hypothetical protein
MRYNGKVEFARARRIGEQNISLLSIGALAYMDLGVFLVFGPLTF